MNPFDFLVSGMMIPFLKFSYHHIYPNYGLAIILLTVIVKAIFYPLSQKQFKSMKAMQVLQPKIKELQAKFKKQPDKLQKELVSFYKENKINPLSGCFPVLIQLPVFFAIYYTITSPMFKQMIAVPGINPGLTPFWITNLGHPDPFFILPLIIAAATYFSQKLMPLDPQQAKIFALMPILMFIISMHMPAGVLLYWAVSQSLSFAQQWAVVKKTPSDSSIIVVKEA